MVTAPHVPPVIPPAAGGRAGTGTPGRGRRPLPVPALDGESARVAETVYALSAVDHSGRGTDRSIVRVLGWLPGTRLDIREHAGIILVTTSADGVQCISDSGFLKLPLTVRRWCRIAAGDR